MQLNEAAARLALNGDCGSPPADCSPSSSSLTAVVSDNRSSSDICQNDARKRWKEKEIIIIHNHLSIRRNGMQFESQEEEEAEEEEADDEDEKSRIVDV